MNCKHLQLLSPAKINLFLQITGKRHDGYHELFTFMCPVSLYDTISFEFDTDKISVSCDNPEVPSDETNLAHKAASLFFEKLNKNKGVNIFINKKIPVAAGLGGGSSNAATVLLGLNNYYNYPFSNDYLMKIALSIGADVPFFILGKPAIATGIGENLKVIERFKLFKILLINPKFNVSTADIYKNFNFGLTKCDKKLKYTSFNDQDFNPVSFLCNDLETVTELKYPEIIIIKDMLMRYGAKGSLMSGSGPTVFGLFDDKEIVMKAFDSISEKEDWKVYQADMIL